MPGGLRHPFHSPAFVDKAVADRQAHWLETILADETLLIQSGASLVYVKEQMGHSSIQVTVDIYGHLIPGANVSFVDKLNEVPQECAEIPLRQSAPGTHQAENAMESIPSELVDLIGGGGRTRTYDLRIMSSEPPVADKQDKGVSSAEPGKVRQNPQPRRNRDEEDEDYYGA